MIDTFWILESTPDRRFPYRLTIRKAEKTIICLRVQDRWPGARGQIFCLPEESREWRDPIEEVERVPVLSLRRLGKRLAVVLDRAQNKRCDFLFIEKELKTRPGKRENIYWRTQSGLLARRPRVKLTTYGSHSLNVIIDRNEKYPWRFPGCHVERGNLSAGDYGLKHLNSILALVERKTYENFVQEFNRMAVFHQQLTELESYENSALVVEANYSDYLREDRLRYYKPSFAAKAVAEICALHPNLQIIFAGNRKLANEWAVRYFSAVMAHEKDIPSDVISRTLSLFGETPKLRRDSYYEVRNCIESMSDRFTISMLRQSCPGIPENTTRRALTDMKKEARIHYQGKAWEKIDQAENNEITP